jgi:serine/threonine protein kinase
MPTSAQMLTGVALADGWTVVSAIPRSQNATGGRFSESYEVQRSDGTKAFLKALDFSSAIQAADPARALQALTEAFNFERDLLASCRDRRMSRIVTAITDGKVQVNNPSDSGVVQYIIFEIADGDVRSQADAANRFDLAFALRALHSIAVGLEQLHVARIAHQDVKPSNVLVFLLAKLAKLGDLGRAALVGATPPHENLVLPGDPLYTPPELAYGHVDPDWKRRRLGADLYHLGSMAVFFFTGQGFTALLSAELNQIYWPQSWGGNYAQVLPHLRDAYDRVIKRFAAAVHPELRDELVTIVRQLCDPDPSLRGHPRNRVNPATHHGLERYISRFDALARKAETGMLSPFVAP